ncbi:MAG: hypothetical protein ABSF34_22720, partial [Verrucomicrobiota bacterium]
MAGVAFRFQNPSNFDVVRISVLGKNIACYKVADGQIVSPYALPLEIPAGTWHTLEVDCSGFNVDCFVDGKDVMQVIPDRTSPPAGKIGFWTKSDAVTYFADATVTYIPKIPAAMEGERCQHERKTTSRNIAALLSVSVAHATGTDGAAPHRPEACACDGHFHLRLRG